MISFIAQPARSLGVCALGMLPPNSVSGRERPNEIHGLCSPSVHGVVNKLSVGKDAMVKDL